MTYKINTVIEKDGHGYFAYAPEFKGCHSQGDTSEEVLENMKEAIELYVESLSDEEKEAEILLIKNGFNFVRSKGSHRIYRRNNERMVLPFNAGKTLHLKIV